MLLLALLVAVASLTAVGFFTSRVSRAVAQQAGEVLAADLRLESARPIADGYAREAARRGLATRPARVDAERRLLRRRVLAGRASRRRARDIRCAAS